MLRGPPEDTVYSIFPDREFDERPDQSLKEIAVPTLVVQGTRDLRVPFECGSYIADKIPGARLYPFENGGHGPNGSAPGEFCEVPRQFVRTG